VGCPTFVNVGGDCPGSGYLTNALPEGDGLTLVREYEDIIFERESDSKPGLAPNVCLFVFLTTLLILTGHCRRMVVSNLYPV
jgi:hypothetical protein